MLSSMPIQAKVDEVHSLFDFNQSGELSIDQLIILLRTVATACCKIDTCMCLPTIDEFESMAQWAFDMADRAHDSEITKFEFDKFVFTHPTLQHFLQLFTDMNAQVFIGPGERWTDEEVPLCVEQHDPPTGLPMVSQSLTLLRPIDFARGPPFLVERPLGRLIQGAMDDTQLLCATAILMTSPNLVRQLFVTTGQEESGRFGIRFFRSGIANVIFIDDRLYCDKFDVPFCSRSTNPCEMWLLLLEKAVAKYLGSYDRLKSVSVAAIVLYDFSDRRPAYVGYCFPRDVHWWYDEVDEFRQR